MRSFFLVNLLFAVSATICTGCFDKNEDGAIKLRIKEPKDSSLARAEPRLAVKSQRSQSTSSDLERVESVRRNTWASWGPPYLLNLVPGDGTERYRAISLPKAWVTLLPKDDSAAAMGCADDTREGFLNVADYPNISACQGDFSPHYIGGPEATAFCAPGWGVCSPAENATDAAIISGIGYAEATGFGSCFAYNASNDEDGCSPCPGTWADPRIMAGMGSECRNATYMPAGSSCLEDGRIDTGIPADCADDAAIKGVVCCRRDSATQSPVCPTDLYGISDERTVKDCEDKCVEYGDNCDTPNPADPPQRYSVRCERSGYIWFCLTGGHCDTTTPIDFYTMAYAPETYCNYIEPAPCPDEFPVSCRHVCCSPDATCENGTCKPDCPPPARECLISGLFTVCCLNGECYDNSCYCPLHLTCDDWCCSIYDQHCHQGRCHDRGPCTDPKYPVGCKQYCCLEGAMCNKDQECNCPPHLPVPCGDECCGAGAQCLNGQCTGGCPTDHPIECRTSSGNQCCLEGSACTAEGCQCPSDLPMACGDGCCPSGSLCIDGECFAVECGYQDYPNPCGEKCCAPGLTCQDNERCSCFEGYPVTCGKLCCIEGSTCEGDSCISPCPAEAPIDCGDGFCCPEGTQCDGEGCTCPKDNPVECGDVCGEPESVCYQGEPTLFECPDGYGVHCANYCCMDGAQCAITSEPCSCPPYLPVDCEEYCCSSDHICVDGECVQNSVGGGSGGCSSNADCAGFASRHCNGPAICDPADQLCHCCMAFCQGSSCSCQSCSACTNDPNTKCVDGVCVFKSGGNQSD